MVTPANSDFSYTVPPSGGGRGWLYGGATTYNGNKTHGFYFNPARDKELIRPSGDLPPSTPRSGLLSSLADKWQYHPTGWNSIT